MREIIWLEDIVEKLEKKHSVRQNEVIEVLENTVLLPSYDVLTDIMIIYRG